MRIVRGLRRGETLVYGFVACPGLAEALAKTPKRRGALPLSSDCHLVLEHGPASRPNVPAVSRLAGGAVCPNGRFLGTLLLRCHPHVFPMWASFARTLKLAFPPRARAPCPGGEEIWVGQVSWELGHPGGIPGCPSSAKEPPWMVKVVRFPRVPRVQGGWTWVVGRSL